MIPLSIGKAPIREGWEARLKAVTRRMIAGLRRKPKTADPATIRRQLIGAMRAALSGRRDEEWFRETPDDVLIKTPGVYFVLLFDAGLADPDPMTAETIMAVLQRILDREVPGPKKVAPCDDNSSH